MNFQDGPSILALPEELTRLIFNYLEPKTLICCYYVCDQWRMHIEQLYEESRWKELCLKHYPMEYREIRKKCTLSSCFDVYRSLAFCPVAVNTARGNMRLVMAANKNKEFNSFCVHKDQLIIAEKTCVELSQRNDKSKAVEQGMDYQEHSNTCGNGGYTGLQLPTESNVNYIQKINMEFYKKTNSILAVKYSNGISKVYGRRKDSNDFDNVLQLEVTDIMRVEENLCYVIAKNKQLMRCTWMNDKWENEFMARYYGTPEITRIHIPEREVFMLDDANNVFKVDYVKRFTRLYTCGDVRVGQYIFNDNCDVVQSSHDNIDFFKPSDPHSNNYKKLISDLYESNRTLETYVSHTNSDCIIVTCLFLSCAISYGGLLITGDLLGRPIISSRQTSCATTTCNSHRIRLSSSQVTAASAVLHHSIGE